MIVTGFLRYTEKTVFLILVRVLLLNRLLKYCIAALIINCCETVYEGNGKNLTWFITYSGEILNKMNLKVFQHLVFSTYDFTTLYTTLLHNTFLKS